MSCKKESNSSSVFVNSIVFKKFGKDNKFKIAETFNQDFVKNFMQEKEEKKFIFTIYYSSSKFRFKLFIY